MIIQIGYGALPPKLLKHASVFCTAQVCKCGKNLINNTIDAAATCPVDIPEEELAKIIGDSEYFDMGQCEKLAKEIITALPGLMKAVRVEKG